MPILKQLVWGSSGSKRRPHSDLTREMISAPLADFRHTTHIGRGGDTFGDTSFLSTPHKSANQVHKNGLLTHRFKSSKCSQSERNSRALSYMLPANSAVSLPYVNKDHEEDVTLSRPKSTSANFSETTRETVVMSGQSLEMEEQHFRGPSDLPTFTPPFGRGINQAESMISFHVDLGPSMLRDVLGVMDQTEQDHIDDQRRGLKMLCPLKYVSMSSCGFKEEKPQQAHETETCSTTFNININEKDFLFMDEDEDEIVV